MPSRFTMSSEIVYGTPFVTFQLGRRDKEISLPCSPSTGHSASLKQKKTSAAALSNPHFPLFCSRLTKFHFQHLFPLLWHVRPQEKVVLFVLTNCERALCTSYCLFIGSRFGSWTGIERRIERPDLVVAVTSATVFGPMPNAKDKKESPESGSPAVRMNLAISPSALMCSVLHFLALEAVKWLKDCDKGPGAKRNGLSTGEQQKSWPFL